MRIMTLFLVFLIGFNGFSAAAHIDDSQKCGPGVAIEKIEKSVEVSAECASHVTGQQDKSDTSSDASAQADQHICTSCGHCCLSHVALAASDTVIALYLSVQTSGIADVVLTSEAVSGLKRPPRIFA